MRDRSKPESPRRAGSGRAAVLAALVVFTSAGSAPALTVNGRVVNGTTGDSPVDATVVIVNPAGGMAQEQTVQTKDGLFSASIDDRASIYLVRVDYKGVMYTSTLSPAGGDPLDVTVTVYEPTSSWEGVTVTSPHVTATRHGDHLSIERLYEIDNASDPPRTLAGEEAAFHLRIPTDMKSINSSYVSALGMPIERQPTRTDVAGVYRMDYPLRPGVTRVGISYTVPYDGETYTLSEELLYDIGELTIYGVDPEMLITAKGARFRTREAAHDMTSYTATDLAKGSEIEIIFTGGTQQSVRETQAGAAPGAVSVASSDTNNVSLIIMLSVLLVLTAVIGFSASTPDPLDQPERVREYYSVLVKRLARLDDMAEADMISNEVYRAKREELKGQLTSLAQRFSDANAGAPAGEPDIVPAPTKEQTNS